ncbi:MAG: hypothetical protein LBV34_10820, partial [Nocardiopsaceae bacterium]|nr:hypothetical protein [Nocardiopsaceae bacterium]
MPAISSYVGYSLEEPWGQPRVVFGLSAKDAEQLSALLNRHDCIGPVHATIGGRGRSATEGAGQGGDQRLHVETPQPREPDRGGSSQGRRDVSRRGWIAPPGRAASSPRRDADPLGDGWLGPHGNDTGPLGRAAGPLSEEIAQLGREAGPSGAKTGRQGEDADSRGQDVDSQGNGAGSPGQGAAAQAEDAGPQGPGTGQQDREHSPGLGLPLPVPPQAPYFIAEQSSSDDGRSPWRTWRSDNVPDELDGPVYRRIARAAREEPEAEDATDASKPANQDAASRTKSGEDGARAEQAPKGQKAAGKPRAKPASGQAAAKPDPKPPAESKASSGGSTELKPASGTPSESKARPGGSSQPKPAASAPSGPKVGNDAPA